MAQIQCHPLGINGGRKNPLFSVAIAIVMLSKGVVWVQAAVCLADIHSCVSINLWFASVDRPSALIRHSGFIRIIDRDAISFSGD
jgi:hypothetical protein